MLYCCACPQSGNKQIQKDLSPNSRRNRIRPFRHRVRSCLRTPLTRYPDCTPTLRRPQYRHAIRPPSSEVVKAVFRHDIDNTVYSQDGEPRRISKSLCSMENPGEKLFRSFDPRTRLALPRVQPERTDPVRDAEEAAPDRPRVIRVQPDQRTANERPPHVRRIAANRRARCSGCPGR